MDTFNSSSPHVALSNFLRAFPEATEADRQLADNLDESHYVTHDGPSSYDNYRGDFYNDANERIKQLIPEFVGKERWVNKAIDEWYEQQKFCEECRSCEEGDGKENTPPLPWGFVAWVYKFQLERVEEIKNCTHAEIKKMFVYPKRTVEFCLNCKRLM